MTQPMDEIDQKQQEEISDLQKKDIKHDERLSLYMHLYVGLFVIVLALFIGAIIVTPLLMMSDNRCSHGEARK